MMNENPFEWMLRATEHEVRGIKVYDTLISVGKLWQEEEREFECSAKRPFTHTGIDGNQNEPLIPPCADHTRYVEIDGRCACVIEPYRKDMDDIEELIIFCKEHGLTFSIDGESSHFPGGCTRIVIKEQTAIQ